MIVLFLWQALSQRSERRVSPKGDIGNCGSRPCELGGLWDFLLGVSVRGVACPVSRSGHIYQRLSVLRSYRAPLYKAGVLALVAILLRVLDAQTGLPFYREVRYLVFFGHILVVAAASCFLASWIRERLEESYA